jgi:hypothetical protein
MYEIVYINSADAIYRDVFDRLKKREYPSTAPINARNPYRFPPAAHTNATAKI